MGLILKNDRVFTDCDPNEDYIADAELKLSNNGIAFLSGLLAEYSPEAHESGLHRILINSLRTLAEEHGAVKEEGCDRKAFVPNFIPMAD